MWYFIKPDLIISLSQTSALLPNYWKVNEVAIDKKDQYVFRSGWDYGFYRRYVDKTKFQALPGYIEPVEINSFMASTIMNISDDLKLEKYVDTITIENNTINNISGIINNDVQLNNVVYDDVSTVFETYVNTSYNYRELDTLDDDIKRYIEVNIIPRYTIKQTKCYVKYYSLDEDVDLIVTDKTEQELLLDGFVLLDNIQFKVVQLNQFNLTFNYSKPTDKQVALSFVTNIEVL